MFMKRNILSDFGGSSRTSPVSSRLPSEGANSLRPSPELRRGQNRSDFEIDQVIPMRSPGLQQLQALCLHELETARPAGLHPTGNVLDSGRQHPAVRAKALAHLRQTAGLEVFNDHEEHGWESIRNPRRAKPYEQHAAAEDEQARSALECGSSSYRFVFAALPRFSYEPRAEGGSCCYRTPKRLGR